MRVELVELQRERTMIAFGPSLVDDGGDDGLGKVGEIEPTDTKTPDVEKLTP